MIARKQMRLKRELEIMTKSQEFEIEQSQFNSQECWFVNIQCPADCIYSNEKYRWGKKTEIFI